MDCGVDPSECEVEAGTLQCRGCCGHEPEKPTAKRFTQGLLVGAMQSRGAVGCLRKKRGRQYIEDDHHSRTHQSE